MLSRISTVGGEKGSADTVRDIRGFAVKIFTEEGNQDFVFNDLPVFFVRDPVKFPSMNRSHKKHPQTNVPDENMFWDYHVHNQESIHAIMQLFSKRGIPESLRHVNAFGVQTYSLYKEDGSYVYIKWHFKPDGGVKSMDPKRAGELAGSNPDYHVKELFDALAAGNAAHWTLYVQVMKPEQVKDVDFNVFDDTYIWPHDKFPLRPVGRLTLDKNPENFFEEIEQAAFSPSNMVPGIGPSPDPVLQARMFSYPDAARYRVGPNYQQLPPNKAHSKVFNPFERDGPMRSDGNYGSQVNYVGSEFVKPMKTPHRQPFLREKYEGTIEPTVFGVTDKDFVQPRELWELIKGEDGADDFYSVAAGKLMGVRVELQQEAYSELFIGSMPTKRAKTDKDAGMFGRVDQDLARLIEVKVKEMEG